VRRFGQIVAVKPEAIDEYERLHAEPPSEVLEVLTTSGITNYSIYRHQTTLFQYFEYHGNNFDYDMRLLAEHPVPQDWWKVCKPLQEPLPERGEGEWWLDMPEIFHMR
jgi:L-rhamnose mutarotase